METSARSWPAPRGADRLLLPGDEASRPQAAALPGLAAEPEDLQAAPARSSRPVARRLRGIDAARALAIFGMVMVHFGPFPVPVEGPPSFLFSSAYGKASILFALLAGIGVSLLAGDRSPRRRRATWARLAFRVAVFVPLGIALQVLDIRVAVILQYYGVYFVVAGLALPLRDRALAVTAGALALVGPVILVLLGGLGAPWQGWFETGGGVEPLDVAGQLRALLLTGYYPTLTWAPVVLAGMWLGRQDLRATAVRWRMVLGGAGLAASAFLASRGLLALLGAPDGDGDWRRLASAEGHSEMPLSLLGAGALAVAILGACLLLADALPRLTWPLVAAGQLALTVYVGHLLVLAVTPDVLVRADVGGAARTVAGFAFVVLALTTAWRARFARGPLEVLLRLPWQLQERHRPAPAPPG